MMPTPLKRYKGAWSWPGNPHGARCTQALLVLNYPDHCNKLAQLHPWGAAAAGTEISYMSHCNKGFGLGSGHQSL